MATVSRPSKSRPAPEKSNQEPSPKGQPRSRRSWWIAAGVVVLVWAAPIIVANTPLRQQVLAALMPGLNGSITAGSASFGWFSPVVFRDLQISDHAGEPLLDISQLVGDRALVNLAVDMSQLGHFRADGAHAHLILQESSSNGEEVLLPWWNTPGSSEGIDMSVDAEGAKVSVRDTQSGRTWELNDIKLSLVMLRGSTMPTQFSLTGNVAAETPGAFSVALDNKGAAQAQADEQPLSVTVKLGALPLDMLDPVVSRFAGEADLSGRLFCDLQCDWQTSDNGPRAKVAGEIACEELALGGAMLSGDTLHLRRALFPCDVELASDRLNIAQLGLQCDLGNVTIQGSTSLAAQSWPGRLASGINEPFHVAGKLDLARLAAKLPKTLRIRSGTEITSGELQFSLDNHAEATGHRWYGEVITTNLLASHAGRQIRWEQPVQIMVAAHRAESGPIVDQLVCRSSFLQVEAAGTPQNFHATANCDLSRLQAELAQFVDLGEFTLAGQGSGGLHWTTANGSVNINADANVAGFALSALGSSPWVEPQLSLAMVAAGKAGLAGVQSIDSATVNVVSGEDRLDARLLTPVQLASTSAAWPVEFSLQGSLARWAPRLNPLVPLNGWDLAGNCDVTGQVHYAANAIELKRAHVGVKDLHAWGHGLFIDEPALQMQMAGRCDVTKSQLQLHKTTFATSSLSWGSDGVTIGLPATGLPTVDGTVDFRGDLERLYRWANDPRVTATWRPVGQASGKAHLSQAGAVAGTTLDAVIQNMALYRTDGAAQQPVWQEPQITLAGNLQYDSAKQNMQLKDVALSSRALRVKIGGDIQNLTTTRNANLQGAVAYDLQTITELLKPYVGNEVRLAGRDERQFSLQGPLGDGWQKQLAAQGSAGWTSAQVYGMQIGQGTIDARLASGILQLGPTELPISEGKLNLAPQLRLTAEPTDVVLPAGPLVQQVRITPEMCDSALKYIAPVLAEATRTQGRISIDLASARIPVANPDTGDISGRLAIHSVEVTPGPLTDQLLLLSRQVEAVLEKRTPPMKSEPTTLLRLGEQNVDFRMVDHRVFHQGMTINAGKVTVRTRGSVGIDQTLSLIADIPVLDEWIGKDPLLSGMRGQTIQVPITGTLSKPRVDPRGIEQLAKQVFRSSTDNLIREGVNRGLERLFNER